MGISTDVFKEAMCRFATGVTVVTTRDGEAIHGITANAFSSVSVDPLLVLVCLAKRLYTHTMIERASHFAVHVLSGEQRAIAERFAGMGPKLEHRFENRPYRTAVTGSPILADTLVWLDCRLWASYDGGDHTIFVGEVLDGEVSIERPPLLYYQRRWGVPAPLEIVGA